MSLSDVDKPNEFLIALNTCKPFGLNELQSKIYLERYHDREKLFYALLLYLCVGIATLLMALYFMPYIILEDNKYSIYWGFFFFFHLLFSILISILVYKNILVRKLFLKLALILWLFIFIGPLVIERNIYYNLRSTAAEKSNDFDNAEAYIRKAIEIHPEGYSYYESLGKILFKKGEYTESIMNFKYLIENDDRLTDYYKAYYHLWIGKSLLKLNRINEAKEEFVKVTLFNISEFNNEVEALVKTNRQK